LNLGSEAREMHIKFDCKCEWKTVNSENSKAYGFPNETTEFMKDRYSTPAVYRWVIDNERYYVGESKNLYRRINAYLKAPKPKYNQDGKMIPHQQTTNINVHNELQASSNNRIEFLEFNELQFGGATYKLDDLENNHIRLLVEKMAIQDHVAKHLKLLNI
jgi:hypothetical protein